jgi:nitric oxide reductase NorQ protein
MKILTPDVGDYMVTEEASYLESGDEVGLFEAAWRGKLPVILQGPTGCGKSRFVSAMAKRLGRPLITVACHEDLSASDLLGRHLIVGDETVWCDGPLTTGVRHGAIVYLDEVVEARNDTLVVIHPLTDHRRMLPLERLGCQLSAPDDFMLVVSYNPGYQSVRKEMKPSTRQRFATIEFDYPEKGVEAKVIQHESGVSAELASALVEIGVRVRELKQRGLDEGVSTRLLVYAGKLMAQGIDARSACEVAFVKNLTDDVQLQGAVRSLVSDHL